MTPPVMSCTNPNHLYIADLDLITRQDFLSYMKAISEADGVTIVYATHIFDGLDDWPTHIGYIAGEDQRRDWQPRRLGS